MNYAVVMTNLVHHSQTGFIRRRHAAENIIKIMQIIDQSDQLAQNNLLMSYDFQKGFDSLEWETIFSTLASFNFGSQYISMVMTHFTDPLICVSMVSGLVRVLETHLWLLTGMYFFTNKFCHYSGNLRASIETK